jgi:hypothetical protein
MLARLNVKKADITQRGFTMHTGKFSHAIACAFSLLLLALFVRADNATVETGWLDVQKGSRDSAVGAEVIAVERGDSDGMQKLTLAIPKKSIANPTEIEEVVVIGQRPEKPEKPERLDMTYEWVGDYDDDNYGLVIRLSRNTNWPIRLYMNSNAGFMR